MDGAGGERSAERGRGVVGRCRVGRRRGARLGLRRGPRPGCRTGATRFAGSDDVGGRKPYRALAPYGPEDADLFVGRERLVAELAARVLDRRLVAVIGASGSGKSSIVRAGLDPLVRSGRLPGGEPWRAHVMVPGTDPIGTLLGIEQIDEPGPQLLIVDQFEEIAASGAADAFAARLLDLVLDAALDVHVVVVVRADQYGTLALSRHLVELIEDAQVLVGPPSEDELRRIATQPARRTGCTVEPELVELLVADVAGQDGTLPLGSAALAEVWERRLGDVLTAEKYVEIGGLAAAVERLGERALDGPARRRTRPAAPSRRCHRRRAVCSPPHRHH